MSPYLLQGNKDLELEFKQNAGNNLTFVDNWESDIIDVTVQRIYSKRKPAHEASIEYVEACRRQFQRDGTNHIVRHSEDTQIAIGSLTDPTGTTNLSLINKLNTKVKEASKLVFFHGAMFEATINVKGKHSFSQSQPLIMLEVSTKNTISAWGPIKLLAAPSGVTHFDISNGIPTEEHLLANNWKKVTINPALDRASRRVTVGSLMGMRKQYSLKHVGAGTINQQTGNTITGKAATEVSKDGKQWIKAQIVVMLSRTTRAKDTIIVGDKEYALNCMWDVITIGDQWTNYIDKLLDRLCINGSDSHTNQINRTINYANDYPYRTCDILIPRDNSGYVYMLVSVKNVHRDYIGQCVNLSKRFYKHNSTGGGSKGTADPRYQPYFLAGYICGMGHLTKAERETLERRWQRYEGMEINQYQSDMFFRLAQGQRVVEEYNTDRREVQVFNVQLCIYGIS
jgi:predicted GIY-YIG superfamily endonuclease